MDKDKSYATNMKPLLKRLYEIEDERKALNKEFRDIAQSIRRLNLWMIKDD
jgi:hypothetical protein